MELRDYQPADWGDVRSFLRAHWRPNHPLTDLDIFRWQFAGFGGSGQPVSQVAVDGRKVVGFLGGIPGLYRCGDEVVPGVAFDVWIVDPQIQNRGLGLLLMKALEDRFSACCSLGVNPKVVHYYTRRGYQHRDRLHRWIVPLRLDGCQRLIAFAPETSSVTPSTVTPPAVSVAVAAPPARHTAAFVRPLVEAHARLLEAPAAAVEPMPHPDPGALAELHLRSTAQWLRFGLHRTAEFWTWRYLHCPVHEYLFFGTPTGPGVVVARVEAIVSPDNPVVHGLNVLRLIELLPARPETWDGGADGPFAELLAGVLMWAIEAGCVLADFQHSSPRLSGLLEWLGFAPQNAAAAPVFAAVPPLFAPLRYNVGPINYVFRSPSGGVAGPTLDPRDVYLVKSDAGMDRPHVWSPAAAE